MVSALSQMTSWSRASAKYWMFFSKSFLCLMTCLIPGAYTPPLSNISQNQFLPLLPDRSLTTWTKNTSKHQILPKSHTNYLDVWRPNSNKSQYHQFVWVLSSDLVQWLRYLLAISFLEVRKAEKAAPTPPTNATWLQTNPLEAPHLGLQIVHFPQSVQTSAAPRGSKH